VVKNGNLPPSQTKPFQAQWWSEGEPAAGRNIQSTQVILVCGHLLSRREHAKGKKVSLMSLPESAASHWQ